MANPQAENGHIDIANEIGEALGKIRVPGEAGQVLWVIFRKTYGWHKKEDGISLSQFSLATGLKKDKVCRALNKLRLMNLVISQKGNDGITKYSFNKDFDSWKPFPKKEPGVPKKEIIISQKGNQGVPKKEHTKENITKENQKKKDDEETSLDVPAKKKREPSPYTREAKVFIDWFIKNHQKRMDEVPVLNFSAIIPQTASILRQMEKGCQNQNELEPIKMAVRQLCFKAIEMYKPCEVNYWLKDKPKTLSYLYSKLNSIDISGVTIGD